MFVYVLGVVLIARAKVATDAAMILEVGSILPIEQWSNKTIIKLCKKIQNYHLAIWDEQLDQDRLVLQ